MDDITNYKCKEFQRKYNISRHTVRIEMCKGNSVGTGFLYTVKDSLYVYIMTACHVICSAFKYGDETTINISYADGEKEYKSSEFEICTLYKENEHTKELYERLEDEETGEERYKDIAVLRIKKQVFSHGSAELPMDICRLLEEKVKRDMIFVGNGFPDGKVHYEELHGLCYGWELEKQMITCKAANIDYQPFEDAMKGFSGTGLLVEYKGGPVLMGIVAACDKNEMHQQFRIVGTTQITKRLIEIGWETLPEYDDEKPPERFYYGNMKVLQNEYLEDLNTSTKILITKEISGIDSKISPKNMVKGEAFYDIPLCPKNRKNCEYYWCGRIWPILVAKVFGGDIQGNSYKYKCKDGKELSIEYICSEGNGKVTLASVVEAATNNLVLGKHISGDSILIWQSKSSPITKRAFSKERFKNIIKDIAYGDGNKYKDISRNTAYDLLDGEMSKKNYGIIHIQYLIDELDGCNTEEDMKRRIGEILDGIWE